MAYQDMSIEELETQGNAIEDQVKLLRAEQFIVHQAAEQKRSRIPVIATPMDQTLIGGKTDWVEWAKGLPKEALEAITGKKE